MIDNLSTLADALIPHLVDRLGGGGGGSGVTTTLPSVIRWSDIDKSGASLYDIPDRPHGALTYKNVDDHLQYVPQAGRGGFAYLDAITRVRYPADTRYRSDHYLLGSGGTVLNSVDDAGLTYLPLYLDAAFVHLRPGGNSGLAVGATTYWYSGINAINTDNYVSQLAGLHLGYDGSIDCRYLYTEQLHAKAFIADLEQALAGAQIITKSVTLLDQTFTAPYPGIGLPLTVKDLPSAHGMQVFQAGDYVRVRQFSRAGGGLSITDCWGQVYSPVDNGNGTQTWNFIRGGAVTYNTIAFVNATAVASAGTGASLSPTKPTGTASGHVLLAEVVYTGSPTVTEPAGWTLITTHTATGLTAKYYYKLAGGSEPAAYTWNFSSSTNAAIVVAAYSGCNAAHYIDGYNVSHTDSGTAMTAPGGIYPYSTAGMLVFLGATTNVRATPPSGMTERADLGSASAGVYLADQLLASGASTSSKTATLATASASIGLQILLTPSYTALNTEAGAMAPFSLVEPDAIILDYGVSGNGYAEVTTVDGIYGANSPYYQIVTWTGHPATGASLKARLGNLAGVTDATLSPSGYGLYTDNFFGKGDFVTAGGLIRMDASSGINLQEAGGGGIVDTADLHALQWWPDVSNRSGVASLSFGAAEPTTGTFSGWNIANLNVIPNNGVVAQWIARVSGQGTGNDAVFYALGGSQALGAQAEIFLSADNLTMDGNLKARGLINDERFALDTSGDSFNIGAGVSLPFSTSGAFSGLVMLIDLTSGSFGLYAMGGGSVNLVSSAGGIWTANTTSGSNAFDVSYVSSKYQLKNKYATTKSLNIMALRARAFA